MGKESACNAGDAGDSGSIPGLGRASGGGRGNPLQYSCLENSVDRGAWRATVHGVAPCSLLEELAGSSTVAVLASLPLRAFALAVSSTLNSRPPDFYRKHSLTALILAQISPSF